MAKWYLGTAFIVATAIGASFNAASAQTIIDHWDAVRPPSPPTLDTVKIDPGNTALLVLDLSGTRDAAKGPCNLKKVPSCIASLPAVERMLSAARSSGVFVVYSLPISGDRRDIAPEVAPLPSDPVVKSGPDKFIGTDLGRLLAAKSIKKVVIVGTVAEGAVLDTAIDAILKEKLTVVIPVDGMSSASLYPEQYVAWDLTHAPFLAGKVTLTQGDKIEF